MLSCINGATTMPYSFEEDMAAAGAAGFQAVEVWSRKLFPYLESHSVSQAAEVIARNGLRVASLCPITFGFFRPQDEVHQKLQEAAEVAQGIGCNLLLVCPDVPPADLSHAEAIRRAAEAAQRSCDVVAPYGVRLALEPLGGHAFVPGPAEAMEIISRVNRPDFLLMMDTFHYFKSGVSVDVLRDIPLDKMSLIHVNSAEALPRDKLTDKHRLWPTLGVVPAAEMVCAFTARGYDGALSVEVFRDEYWAQPVGEITAQAKAHLEKLMAEL